MSYSTLSRRGRLSINLYLYACVLALALASGACVTEAPEAITAATAEAAHEGPRVPDDYFFRQRAFPQGTLDQEAYHAALAERNDEAEAPGRSTLAGRSLQSATWQLDGPTEVGGRITDIEVVPAASLAGGPEVWLIGAASGGVWRSEDEGDTWAPTFDGYGSLAIGDLDVAPSNPHIVYCGTGEANPGGGSLTYDGTGVYRSDDAGLTWRPVGLAGTGSIGRLLVSATDPDRVLAAAMGTQFANGPRRGVFLTEDGGATWTHTLAIDDETGTVDLASNPARPNTVFAATWQRVRRRTGRKYHGPGSGLHVSRDGGVTWADITARLPGVMPEPGRISVAVAPSDPDHVYASLVGASGSLELVYASDDGGDTWTSVTLNSVRAVSFDWWFNRVVVDPSDPERLYYVGFVPERIDVARDGAWTELFDGTHVDQHALWIDPANSNRILLGNDGGLYRSDDGGLTHTFVGGLPITQFYSLAIDASRPRLRFGGTQDNGTRRGDAAAAPGSSAWGRILGGDGMTVRVDPVEPNVVYASYQRGKVFRSDDDGANFRYIAAGLPPDDRYNWRTPFVLDPSDHRRLYLGGGAVYRSDDRGLTWTPISADLTDGDQGGNGITFGTVTTLDVSAADPDVLWAGTDDGHVWARRGPLPSDWTDVSAGLPRRWVTSVTADPADPATAYVTLSGYRHGEAAGHVYATDDLGATWRDISGDLADVPVNDLVVDPALGYLYVATDVGVYASTDGGAAWVPLGQGMPAVVTTALAYLDDAPARLVAATYGRGMYSTELGVISGTHPDYARAPFAWSAAPNPLTEGSRVDLQLPAAARVGVRLTDATGRVRYRRAPADLAAGAHSLSIGEALRGAALPPGAYALELYGDGWRESRAVLVP